MYGKFFAHNHLLHTQFIVPRTTFDYSRTLPEKITRVRYGINWLLYSIFSVNGSKTDFYGRVTSYLGFPFTFKLLKEPYLDTERTGPAFQLDTNKYTIDAIFQSLEEIVKHERVPVLISDQDAPTEVDELDVSRGGAVYTSTLLARELDLLFRISYLFRFIVAYTWNYERQFRRGVEDKISPLSPLKSNTEKIIPYNNMFHMLMTQFCSVLMKGGSLSRESMTKTPYVAFFLAIDPFFRTLINDKLYVKCLRAWTNVVTLFSAPDAKPTITNIFTNITMVLGDPFMFQLGVTIDVLNQMIARVDGLRCAVSGNDLIIRRHSGVQLGKINTSSPVARQWHMDRNYILSGIFGGDEFYFSQYMQPIPDVIKVLIADDCVGINAAGRPDKSLTFSILGMRAYWEGLSKHKRGHARDYAVAAYFYSILDNAPFVFDNFKGYGIRLFAPCQYKSHLPSALRLIDTNWISAFGTHSNALEVSKLKKIKVHLIVFGYGYAAPRLFRNLEFLTTDPLEKVLDTHLRTAKVKLSRTDYLNLVMASYKPGDGDSVLILEAKPADAASSVYIPGLKYGLLAIWSTNDVPTRGVIERTMREKIAELRAASAPIL